MLAYRENHSLCGISCHCPRADPHAVALLLSCVGLFQEGAAELAEGVGDGEEVEQHVQEEAPNEQQEQDEY